jgi:hypothetical protein
MANGDGYLVQHPPGGRGCGFDWLSCFPEFSGSVTSWLALLQAAYSPDAPVPLLRTVDALPLQVSSTVVDALSAKWQAASAAGRDANAVADAALSAAVESGLAQLAAASGAEVAAGATEALATAVDAIADAGQAEAEHLLDAVQALHSVATCTRTNQGSC